MTKNLILIGMPASGKSTLGVMTAKALGWDFIDTDVYIQTQEQQKLHEIIETQGTETFRQLESHHVRQLNVHHCVIATGGSVVFGAEAMEHLTQLGHTIWLKVDLNELNHRIGDIVERGVIHQPGQTLTDILNEREIFYHQYAQTTIDCTNRTPEQLVRDLIRAVSS